MHGLPGRRSAALAGRLCRRLAAAGAVQRVLPAVLPGADRVVARVVRARPRADRRRGAGRSPATFAVSSLLLIPSLLRYKAVHDGARARSARSARCGCSARSRRRSLQPAHLLTFWPTLPAETQEGFLFPGLTVIALSAAGVAGAGSPRPAPARHPIAIGGDVLRPGGRRSWGGSASGRPRRQRRRRRSPALHAADVAPRVRRTACAGQIRHDRARSACRSRRRSPRRDCCRPAGVEGRRWPRPPSSSCCSAACSWTAGSTRCRWRRRRNA